MYVYTLQHESEEKCDSDEQISRTEEIMLQVFGVHNVPITTQTE